MTRSIDYGNDMRAWRNVERLLMKYPSAADVTIVEMPVQHGIFITMRGFEYRIAALFTQIGGNEQTRAGGGINQLDRLRLGRSHRPLRLTIAAQRGQRRIFGMMFAVIKLLARRQHEPAAVHHLIGTRAFAM